MMIPQAGGLVRRKDAANFLALSLATLKRRERDDPTFSKPVVISERAVGCYTSELLAWAAARPAAVGNTATAAASAALALKRVSERRTV